MSTPQIKGKAELGAEKATKKWLTQVYLALNLHLKPGRWGTLTPFTKAEREVQRSKVTGP
jgi:hypothetical protein